MIEVKVLGTMYTAMTLGRDLIEIFEEDLIPLFAEIQSSTELSATFSMMWRAMQRGRVFYSPAEMRRFATYLVVADVGTLKKSCVELALRLLVDERAFGEIKALMEAYEFAGGDEETIKLGKILYLWNEMTDPVKYAECAKGIKELVGVN